MAVEHSMISNSSGSTLVEFFTTAFSARVLSCRAARALLEPLDDLREGFGSVPGGTGTRDRATAAATRPLSRRRRSDNAPSGSRHDEHRHMGMGEHQASLAEPSTLGASPDHDFRPRSGRRSHVWPPGR